MEIIVSYHILIFTTISKGEVLPDKYFISESVMQLQYLRFSFSSFFKPETQSSVKHPVKFSLNSHHRCIQVFSPL